MKILSVKRAPLFLCLTFVFAQSVSAQSLLINEVDADQVGTDNGEFVELFDGGVGNIDLSGLVLVLYNGSDDASYGSIDLDGFSTNAAGYFVICGNDVFGVPNCDLTVLPSLQNGEDAVALLIGDAIDYPNDTPLPADANIVDAIVYETGSDANSALLALLNVGQAVVDEGGAGDQTGHSMQRCPNGAGGARNTDTYQQLTPSPGVENSCATPPPVVGGPYEIWEIQGDGLSSPFVTQRVLTQNNIVTALASVGFFMQSSAPDSDINTSDGLFVFTGSKPTVAVGDLVDVTGDVVEFFRFTQISNEPKIVVTNNGIVLPAPVALDANTPSPDPEAPSCAIEYECYEGMRVSIASAIVTAPNQSFGGDPIAEVYITMAKERAFREPGIEYPGRPGLPVWDGNPEVFELDADKLLGFFVERIIPVGASVRATGVIAYEFGDYELWPSELLVTAPKPVTPGVRKRTVDEFTVGSLNMFRLFDDVDDPSDTNASGRARNDNVVATDEYEIRRAKFVNYILNVIDAPDVLGVQEVESLTVLQALAADIVAADPEVTYTAYLIEGNDIGTIDVGFLVRDTVAVDAITQLGKDEILAFDLSLLHDRPPLLLEGRSLNAGDDYPFTVMVVHNRSLSGVDSTSPVSRGERVRAKRLAQAQSIAEKVQAMQADDPDIHLIVLGDFNAFEFSDGYVDAVGQISGAITPGQNLLSGPDLVDPNLINQTLSVPPEERYSYIFNGNAQALDHVLTSSALEPFITGLEFGRGNADSAEDLINDGTTPLASSDHDGLVLFVQKPPPPPLVIDSDNDGVMDDVDVCLGTVIPEMSARTLRRRRFALTDDDFVFDTKGRHGHGRWRSWNVFTTADTAGCSCTQIVDARRSSDNQHGSRHHRRQTGCSAGVMKSWIAEQRETGLAEATTPSESKIKVRTLLDAPIRFRRHRDRGQGSRHE